MEDGRAGSNAHPCAVLPKCRVHAAFPLGFLSSIKKIQAACLRKANPIRRPQGLLLLCEIVHEIIPVDKPCDRL